LGGPVALRPRLAWPRLALVLRCEELSEADLLPRVKRVKQHLPAVRVGQHFTAVQGGRG
jgi:hypothetical protein